MGIQATTALVDATVRGASAATEAVGVIASAGLQVASVPVREAGRLRSGETASLTRRCWSGEDRAWIEVRGLSGTGELGRHVLDALGAQPGVLSARLNLPLSRVVVELSADGDRASLNDLCRLVAATERRCRGDDNPAAAGTPAAPAPAALPGDGLLLAARGAMVGVNAAGLAIALAGWALRLPQAPVAVDAAAALVNYQPWLRRQLIDRIGTGPAHTVLSLVSTGARIATLSPAALAVDLALQGIKAAENQAGAQAWVRHEPHLARHAEQAEVQLPARPVPLPEGAADRYGNRMAFVQLIGAGLAGVFSRSATVAATAAVVAGPKA
ncbi:MAG: cation-translocating P-type ATPase, partial [Actinomycetota bacterium]|nr:cation-translocating P-type ATPase [Actinomycetota bacterium]